ncbi:MAG: thiamine pyrophosphate-binding protein [Planctomycetes bacterium]|nr:thiamine pyrophosphate-binding protein [Planctomycetota bacterium]
MERNIACDIAETLKKSGLDKFFMLTGGDQALWIALRDQGVKMIVARSEASAVYMADGYARASGGPAVVYGQAGPGAANVAAALADAFWAQSPVMALTGTTATGFRHANEYQDLDQFSMFGPVTRWNARAENPGQAVALIRQALRMTMAGTPGPVHLDIPKDFFAIPSKGLKGDFRPLSPPNLDYPGDSAILADMVEKLRQARRPVILAGEGVRFAGAGQELAHLATAAGLPIVATMGGKPAVLASHPNFIGITGRYSSVKANAILKDADTVLVLGSRLGGLATKGYTIPSPDARILQIDGDASAFANPFFPECCLWADLRAALKKMAEMFGDQPLPGAWLSQCRETVEAWRRGVRAAMEAPDKPGVVSPMAVLSSLANLGDAITLVADTGYMAAWTGVLYPLARYDGFFRAAGSLGWALPASLGIQMAKGGKTICVTGDGGIGYHLADIETAVRYKLPVVIVVLNNDCLAFEYHEQKYRWQGQVVDEANNFTRVSYAAAAEALGARGIRADTRLKVDEALREAMRRDEPTIVEVVTDPEAFPPVSNFEAVMERTI